MQSSRFKFLSAALSLVLACTPELFAQAAGQQQSAQQQQQQQSAQPAPSSEQPAATPDRATPAPQAPATGTTVNPSQPPLQPVTTYPGASETQQNQETSATGNENPANTPEAPQPKQKKTEPVGAATAQRVPTAGGAAAKPAGAAIAPAKQHQTRSLLIKIGAIAAAGAAVGMVYALSRGTSSTPPNAAAGVPK